MYDNNGASQIGGGSSHRRSAEGSQATGWDDLPSHLRPHKDEKGRPLGNTTDNSSILTQQGFQAIKERFKLLDSARKILDGGVIRIITKGAPILILVRLQRIRQVGKG